MNLDTPLNKYPGNNYDAGDDPRINLITARHVLTHSSGFTSGSLGTDSLAEGYMTLGENAKAIRCYEKSIALDPKNTNAIEMVKKLKAL